MIAVRFIPPGEPLPQPGLSDLLADAVHGGASVGFLAPLAPGTAAAYWHDVAASLGPGLLLWVAEDGDEVVGAVQLAPALRENGLHRAEVCRSAWARDSHRRPLMCAVCRILGKHRVRTARTSAAVLVALSGCSASPDAGMVAEPIVLTVPGDTFVDVGAVERFVQDNVPKWSVYTSGRDLYRPGQGAEEPYPNPVDRDRFCELVIVPAGGETKPETWRYLSAAELWMKGDAYLTDEIGLSFLDAVGIAMALAAAGPEPPRLPPLTGDGAVYEGYKSDCPDFQGTPVGELWVVPFDQVVQRMADNARHNLDLVKTDPSCVTLCRAAMLAPTLIIGLCKASPGASEVPNLYAQAFSVLCAILSSKPGVFGSGIAAGFGLDWCKESFCTPPSGKTKE
jgi:hypothetical protein